MKLAADRAVVAEQVLDFVRGRLRAQWSEEFDADLVEAVLGAGFDDVVDARRRLEALAEVKARADFVPLALAFKRVANIQEKAGTAAGAVVNPGAPARRGRAPPPFRARARRGRGGIAARARANYPGVLRNVATLEPAVARFFDDVLVMAEDPASAPTGSGSCAGSPRSSRTSRTSARSRRRPRRRREQGTPALTVSRPAATVRVHPCPLHLRTTILAAALAAALSACGPPPSAESAPLDRFSSPIALALSGGDLLVVSSNFDLAYDLDDGGSVIPWISGPPRRRCAGRGPHPELRGRARDRRRDGVRPARDARARARAGGELPLSPRRRPGRRPVVRRPMPRAAERQLPGRLGVVAVCRAGATPADQPRASAYVSFLRTPSNRGQLVEVDLRTGAIADP